MADPGNAAQHDDLLRESEDLQRRMVEVARDVADFAQRLDRMTRGLCDEVKARTGEGPDDGGDRRT